MIGMRIDKAKANFFDRPAVENAVGKASASVLSGGGALVRQIARRSMRPAAQKKISELTPKERERWLMMQAIFKRKGLNPRKVRRPLRHSKPGEPPRTIRGDIKKFLFFAFDAASKTVLVGPALLNSPTGAPHTLEYGGTAQIGDRTITIKPRPYMAPAVATALPKLHQLWKDAMHKHY